MSFWPILIVSATLFVAYANGANDNFKGVSTLFGSGLTDYRKALWWATAATAAGSLTALFVATRLISVFQGTGVVPPHLTESPPFVAAVVLGAAVTVFLAAQIGMPLSTTHSLTGALAGAGILGAGFDLGLPTLFQSFLLPLLVSPLLAVGLSLAAYPLLSAGLRFAGVGKQTCVCVGSEAIPVSVTPQGYVLSQSSGLRVVVDQERQCVQRFVGGMWAVNVQRWIDSSHFLSAGAVSFARGLNDTPKIVAAGLAASALEISGAVGFVALGMALGGLLSARKVAETVSKRITRMEPDEGFVANLVTSLIVIFASKWGLPVATTHVSCGALFGIGMANGQARWGVVRSISLAWILTFPFAGLSAGGIYAILSRLPVA